MTDQIPPSLLRFGAEYERAVRRELSSGHQARRSRRRRIRLAAVSTTALAAIAAAVVLVIGATTGAAPAYALTHNADGSITITLHDLTTGIPALNARLRQMGINYTVIPVTQNCPFSTPVLSGPGPGSLSETITIGTQNTEPAGVNAYLAAERLPNGSIGLADGGMKAPLPSCFSPTLMKVQPSNTPDPGSTAAKSLTTSTTRSLPPLPVPAAVRRHLNAEKSHATSLTTSTTRSLPPTTNK
jgi:hypothetical protein